MFRQRQQRTAIPRLVQLQANSAATLDLACSSVTMHVQHGWTKARISSVLLTLSGRLSDTGRSRQLLQGASRD